MQEKHCRNNGKWIKQLLLYLLLPGNNTVTTHSCLR
jgi:hypothetical protein